MFFFWFNLRDGLDQFFYLVTEKCIPLLIISAGIGGNNFVMEFC